MISDLDDPNPFTAWQAFRRLRELGPAAREALQFMWWERLGYAEPSPKQVNALARLVVEIQAEYGIQPVYANGLKFLIVTDPVWRVPPAGTERQIKLGLKVTNCTEEEIKLEVLNWVYLELWTDTGERVKDSGGNSPFFFVGKGAPPPLGKGQSYTLKRFITKLCKSADGKELRVESKDNSILFEFKGLKPGRYFLRFGCRAQDHWSPHEGTPKWRGIISPLVALAINEACREGAE
jgi:hypothetical protein